MAAAAGAAIAAGPCTCSGVPQCTPRNRPTACPKVAGSHPTTRQAAGQLHHQTPVMQQAWQRRSGGFSGAAKKEYLKWKRQQAAARTDDSSSDEGHAAAESQTVHDGGASTASTGAGATAQQRRQRVSPYSSESAEVTAPLCYRPLVAVPAAPFSMSAQQQSSSTELAGSADVADAHSSQPAATSSSQGSAEPVPAQLTYMPRLNPAEVGFTPEGCTLGMPTRPAWQVRACGQLLLLLLWLRPQSHVCMCVAVNKHCSTLSVLSAPPRTLACHP